MAWQLQYPSITACFQQVRNQFGDALVGQSAPCRNIGSIDLKCFWESADRYVKRRSICLKTLLFRLLNTFVCPLNISSFRSITNGSQSKVTPIPVVSLSSKPTKTVAEAV